MVYSMTGYGRGEYEENGVKFMVEVKSTNNRYCDISIKIPKVLGRLESRLKQLTMKFAARGKIDVFVSLDEAGADSAIIKIDEGMADAWYQSINVLKKRYKFGDDISLSTFSQIPGVMKVENKEIDDNEMWEILSSAASMALETFKFMKGKEGATLAIDIRSKLSIVKNILYEIEMRAPLTVLDYKARLTARIKELIEDQDIPIEESRLAMEVAILADRTSIDEEIVRLKSHISMAEKCQELSEPIGRKLDFIVQEMIREINTIGSKSNDLEINRNVVEMKSEIEKIREQIQNLE
ncbi:MAG: YicC family protein [Oscillospiraceae bacterium]|nr:YicC family protein [Oscillospiraceae bacterium]